MQTTLLKEHYVTVADVLNAGIYIWKREAIYTYQWIKGERVMRLYGFFGCVNKSDGLVDCGNGVVCMPANECYLENLTHVE